MTATPIWFGDDERPLFGWFHTPATDAARAGVVICPPFVREYLHSHYALRLLAEQLTELGHCVLRLDYDGTGDSAGDSDDPDRVQAWKASVQAAISYIRGAGMTSVVVVGMRMGATLAGVVAEADGDLEALVLWDPVVSGKAYLSEQRAVSALSFEVSTATADGSVETPGVKFDAVTARDLRSLDLARTTGPLARRVLLLQRSDREPGRLAARLDLPHVERAEATGQAQLLDVGAPDQLLPMVAIDRIARWVSGVTPARPSPVRRPTPAGPAIVAHDCHGVPVVETPTLVGPARLFGIMTESSRGHTGPSALFVSVANEHRIGPSRLWVDLARRWAAAGIRSLRLDLSGLGDSPTRSAGQPRFVTRAPEAFDDVLDAAQAICSDPSRDLVMIGLCSAAYQVLDSAFMVKPKAVVAVNPVLSFQPAEIAAGLPLDPRRRIALPRNRLVESFHGENSFGGLRERFPDLGWKVRIMATPQRRPARWLRQLVASNVDVMLVCGQREARPIRLGASERTLNRLRRTGRFRFNFIPDLEHGLLISDQRDAVADLVTEHVQRQFVVPGQSPIEMSPVG